MMTAIKPWGQAEKDAWFSEQPIKRSYLKEVVVKIQELKSKFEVIQYGALSLNKDLYPLYLVKTKFFDPKKKTILQKPKL